MQIELQPLCSSLDVCLSTVMQGGTCTSDVVVKSVVGVGSYGEHCFYIMFCTTHHSALNSKESNKS